VVESFCESAIWGRVGQRRPALNWESVEWEAGNKIMWVLDGSLLGTKYSQEGVVRFVLLRPP
jgi:hypothetical protein